MSSGPVSKTGRRMIKTLREEVGEIVALMREQIFDEIKEAMGVVKSRQDAGETGAPIGVSSPSRSPVSTAWLPTKQVFTRSHIGTEWAKEAVMDVGHDLNDGGKIRPFTYAEVLASIRDEYGEVNPRNLHGILGNLTKSGFIQKIRPGVYMLDKKALTRCGNA